MSGWLLEFVEEGKEKSLNSIGSWSLVKPLDLGYTDCCGSSPHRPLGGRGAQACPWLVVLKGTFCIHSVVVDQSRVKKTARAPLPLFFLSRVFGWLSQTHALLEAAALTRLELFETDVLMSG